MTQIKKIQSLIEESSDKNKAEMKECEVERYTHLVMIGNVLHPSVPISDDEVSHLFKRRKWRNRARDSDLFLRSGCPEISIPK